MTSPNAHNRAAESADSAFDALMARRNGEPLPEPTCPHLSRDHEGNCWACVYDAREREIKAQALREAADFLEGKKGIDGIPRDLWEFRLWLRARADALSLPPERTTS